KALFQSLRRVGALDVRRNLGPLERLAAERPAAVLFLGLDVGDVDSLEEDLLQDWERLAKAGGRLILAFAPVTEKPRLFYKGTSKTLNAEPKASQDRTELRPSQKKPPTRQPGDPSKKSLRVKPGSREDSPLQFVSLKQRWDFNIDFEDLPKSQN